MTPKPYAKKSHNADITVDVVLWLKENEASLKTYTWKQAMHRFNSEKQVQIAPRTFHAAASKLNIEFKTAISRSGTTAPHASAPIIAKVIRQLIVDIETSVGGKVASDRVQNSLTALIGKRTVAEIEAIFNNSN